MLEYTGHPILDVGIATIVAFANKDSPEEITETDLEAIADYMQQLYTDPVFTSHISITFTINAGFTQPGFKKTPEKRDIYGERVLRSFRSSTPVLNELGIFLGLPVPDISFDADGKLDHGRVFRQHIPLQTGENTINFHPGGNAGLPISGLALLAFHAYPLGSTKCGGRTLSVHSDNSDIMLYFANKFLKDNLLNINIAQQAKSRLEEPRRQFRTLLIQVLIEATIKQARSQQKAEPFSITAYHMSNSGQGASLDIYYLPSQIVGYLQLMLSPDYVTAWEQLVRLAWVRPKLKRGQTESPSDFEPDRNYLYEDLFRLAEDVAGRAPQFIRTYFLRNAFRYARDETDPRGQYNTRAQVSLVSWKLTEPFLRRILHMDELRIEQIRTLGDGLAAYVKKQNDKRFFQNFYRESRYANFRNLLIKANTEHVKRGHPPIITLDTYTAVFEDGEELGKSNWGLSRDLLLIRMIEQLYAGDNWFQKHEDAFPEPSEENEA